MSDALTPPFLLAALVLGAAGVAKLRSPDGAAQALQTLRLPGWRLGVRMFAAFEMGLGAWALLRAGVATAVALAVVYAMFAVIALALSAQRAECGCFGESEVPASAAQAAVSGVLALCSAAGLLARPHGAGWVAARPVVALAIVAAVYATVLVYTEVPRAWTAWSGR